MFFFRTCFSRQIFIFYGAYFSIEKRSINSNDDYDQLLHTIKGVPHAINESP
jgi:hypothetical protein